MISFKLIHYEQEDASLTATRPMNYANKLSKLNVD